MKYICPAPLPTWEALLLLVPVLPSTFSGFIFRVNELQLIIHLVVQIGK